MTPGICTENSNTAGVRKNNFTLVCLRDLNQNVDEKKYDFAEISFDRTLIAFGKSHVEENGNKP